MTDVVEKKNTLVHRTLTFTEVTVKTDKNGKPFANFRANTMVKSGARSGTTISIFGQAFGAAFERLKDVLTVGNTANVNGFHERRPADKEKGFAPLRSYVLYKLAATKTVDAEQAAA